MSRIAIMSSPHTYKYPTHLVYPLDLFPVLLQDGRRILGRLFSAFHLQTRTRIAGGSERKAQVSNVCGVRRAQTAARLLDTAARAKNQRVQCNFEEVRACHGLPTYSSTLFLSSRLAHPHERILHNLTPQIST